MKKEALAQVFPCEFYEIFKNTFFFLEHLRWLLLIFAGEFVEILFCYKSIIVTRKFEHDKNIFLLFCLIFQ